MLECPKCKSGLPIEVGFTGTIFLDENEDMVESEQDPLEGFDPASCTHCGFTGKFREFDKENQHDTI